MRHFGVEYAEAQATRACVGCAFYGDESIDSFCYNCELGIKQIYEVAKQDFTWYKNRFPKIKSIHQNESKRVTVVILKDGRKGIAKVCEGDDWNSELGVMHGYIKALEAGFSVGKQPYDMWEGLNIGESIVIGNKKWAVTSLSFDCGVEKAEIVKIKLRS